MGAKRFVKEQLKMLLQHTMLPAVYRLGALRRVQKGLVVFADAHHDSIPFSMKKMYARIKKEDRCKIKVMCTDFQKMSFLSLFVWLVRFMLLYARAEYVFVCDNFLPVSSCKKRSGTKVVQLWHSGGLFKKSGYDTPYSVPEYYKGNVFANYDLLTVSAKCCEPVFERMMRQPPGVVRATGISRSDVLLSKRSIRLCRERFFEKYPEARGRKIVLYAPTFRGSADDPGLCGDDDVTAAFENDKRYFLVKKLHPHYENKHPGSISCDIPCERLLPVADLLITDFSSVLFDYCLYEKPFVIFAPDYDSYVREVGFYKEPQSFPTTVVRDARDLLQAAENELYHRKKEELSEFKRFHMGMCDGNSTDRILKTIGLI